MSGQVLPFRLTVAASFLDGKSRNASETRSLLLPLYPDEQKLCSLASVDMNLQALKAVGILRVAEDGEDPRYGLTPHGYEKVKKNM